MTMTKDPLEKAKQTLDKLQEQNMALQKQLQAGSVLEAEYERLVDKQTKIANRYDKLLMRVGDNTRSKDVRGIQPVVTPWSARIDGFDRPPLLSSPLPSRRRISLTT